MRNAAGSIFAGITLATAMTASCVFPAYRVTGLELSWTFVETNDVDGEAAIRARTCVGASASQLELRIADEDDEERQHVFLYDCATGYQTDEEFQVTASDAFVSLNPGNYDLSLNAVDAGGTRILSAEANVTVEERVATVYRWDLEIVPVDWTLDLSGTEACTDLKLRLLYADPETSLAAPADTAETNTGTDTGANSDVLYRQMLASDGGLNLGGESAACADMGGRHVFTGVDTGRYVLDIVLDGGESCRRPVTIWRPKALLALDLADLDC